MILKIFISLLLIFNIGKTYAADIIILTSIQNPKVNPFWRSSDYEISKDIEKQFRAHFKGSGYTLVFKHQASALVLQDYLTSPDTLALFWVSHARQRVGITKEVVSDFYGNNISSVFQKLHSNIEFLGLVGCSAKSILAEYSKKGFYNKNSKLLTHSFSKSVRLNKAIRESVKASGKVLDRDPKNFMSYKIIERNDKKVRLPTRQTILGIKEKILPREGEINPKSDKDNTIPVVLSNISTLAMATIGDTFLGILEPNKDNHILLPKSKLDKKITKIKITFMKENEDENKNKKSELINQDKIKVALDDLSLRVLIKKQMPNSLSQFIYLESIL